MFKIEEDSEKIDRMVHFILIFFIRYFYVAHKLLLVQTNLQNSHELKFLEMAPISL